ncbi:MAG: hypothetical protein FVQ77_05360 [Cytophagales bacterium]|nr:hypothetical protein [Cytophagales bacterium]
MGRNLFIKLAAFTCIISVLCSCIFFGVAPDKEIYTASLIDKHNYIKTLKSPKIIIIGGSNIAFGIDSRTIEKKFDMPVVNMGVQGSLGYDYMLNEIKEYIHSEDIILIIPEYLLFDYPFYRGAFYDAIEVFPRAITYLDKPKIYSEVVISFVMVLQNKFKRILIRQIKKKRKGFFGKGDVYYRKAFNQYGDVTSHLQLERRKKLAGTGMNRFEKNYKVNSEFIILTNNFSNFVKNHNAKAFFLFPSVAKSAYKKEIAETIYNQLKSEFHVPLICVPERYVFDDTLFFDTVHHHTHLGRKIRTQRIIEDLLNSLHKKLL